MKYQFKHSFTFVVTAALMLLQACQKNPPVPEVDPMFQEKKRPPYNHVILNKTKDHEHDSDYQEVNPNFANDYQDAQREFSKQKPEDIVVSKPKQAESTPLTIQKIRDDAAKLSTTQPVAKNDITPIEPTAPQPKIATPAIVPEPAKQEVIAVQDSVKPSAEVQPITTQVSSGNFEIQAGSYQSEGGAMNVVQKFEKAGVKNIRVDKVDGRHTIRITDSKPFNTREEASKYMQEIIEKTQHYDIMVVKK